MNAKMSPKNIVCAVLDCTEPYRMVRIIAIEVKIKHTVIVVIVEIVCVERVGGRHWFVIATAMTMWVKQLLEIRIRERAVFTICLYIRQA